MNSTGLLSDGLSKAHRNASARRRAAAIVAAAVLLGGCQSVGDSLTSGFGLFGSKEEAFVEAPEVPAGQLYNQGLAYMNEGRMSNAIKSFEEVDRQHPYSDYARKAMLMTAFAHFKGAAYDDAARAAKRFIALYPSSPDAPYAQYIIGESYFRQVPDVTRDQAATRAAMDSMQTIITNYPDSEYAADARKKLIVARDQLAGKEMQIGRYYQERREYIAAVNRFKTVVSDYQDTRHVEEALMRLTETYLAMGLASEAQTAAAILGHNFPDSQWYKDAHARLQGGGLQPNENKGSWLSRVFNRA